ncbi:M20/M25/M40 family metallo-hydrolase [Saccharomonospora cyanea]|uniref:M20/M25/M40 family metallo-hydrolase n=1 Tax=Saccharomonospora cyanea TaxID=40989 RepID=UPI00031BBCB9|nr:M20/M25/M40 family metallo-hydrolase [Saccharomonospora cyanea]
MIARLVDVPRRIAAGFLAVLAVVLAAWVSVAADSSVPPPKGEDAPPEVFSAERALHHLHNLATAARPIGSQASRQTEDELVRQLRGLGLSVEVQRSVGTRRAAGLATFGRVDNIIATLPGTDSTGVVVLTAHHDSAAMGPGAADDGAAVAAALETARALVHGGEPLRNDLVVLLTDGEEDGALGADAFVRHHALARRDGVVLNFEARGVGGPSTLFETSDGNATLVKTVHEVVPHARGNSTLVQLYRLLPNNTDFTPLTRAGFSGLNFAFFHEASRYHTAQDTVERLDPASLQHHGTTMLSLARALGDADLTTIEATHDVTYFPLLGTTVRYPDTVAVPLAVGACGLVVFLGWLVRRRRLATVPRMLLGAASAIVPIVAAAVGAQALWLVLVSLRPGYSLMGGLLHEPVAFEATLLVLTAASLFTWYVPLRGRLGPSALTVGALCWPALLGVGFGWFAPSAAYVFTVPAIVSALAAIIALAVGKRPLWSVISLVVGAAVSTAVLVALAHTALLGMGYALAGVPAVLLAVWGLTLLPLADWFLRQSGQRPGLGTRLGVPAVAVPLVVASVAAGLVENEPGSENPVRSHLAYVLDADADVAKWVSGEQEPTDWTRRHVAERGPSGLPPGYARGELWTGPAPVIDVEGPDVTVSGRTADTLTLHVDSVRDATSVILRFDRPITEVTARTGTAPPATVQVTGIRANTWPGEVRFRDLPPSGVELTVRTAPGDQLRVTAIDETRGLDVVPGFLPRPPHVVAGTREDGDVVAVARTYAF